MDLPWRGYGNGRVPRMVEVFVLRKEQKDGVALGGKHEAGLG